MKNDNAASPALKDLLQALPYAGYAYSYPHKSAYRVLDVPEPLRELWAGEQRVALFLYLHIPFCEMRCGFCNLFTTTGRQFFDEVAYLDALERQAAQVKEALGDCAFARMAVGGGTPTILSASGLERLFNIATGVKDASPQDIPVSVETSPATATAERMAVLRDKGVDRVSIGVQSFLESEVHAVGRPQRTAEVKTALRTIRTAGFPTLNIDLMYGLPGQTARSWQQSLESALEYRPEEIYLYPLYVRPLTGLSKRQNGSEAEEDARLTLYRQAREFLKERGYRQVSMRMFALDNAVREDAPVYCCQQDGMVGLGCGARSYTSGLHYSTEFAVGAGGVREIIANYLQTDAVGFDDARYGFRLDGGERRRRYVIQGLLQASGLDTWEYRKIFDGDVWDEMPQLEELVESSLAIVEDERLVLTETGLEYSDVIGPWLGSAHVREAMAGFALR